MTISPIPACPRCSGVVEEEAFAGRAGVLRCTACTTGWASLRTLEHEITARDLAGTKAAFIDADYLTANPIESKETLRGELEELTALTKLVTYQEVLKSLNMAIDARDNETYRMGKWTMEVDAEIKSLKSMRKWILEEMEKYGESNGSV